MVQYSKTVGRLSCDFRLDSCRARTQGRQAPQCNLVRIQGGIRMREQRITVTIDADGKMSAKTDGLKGETCIEELEALLSELAELDDVKHTENTRRRTHVPLKTIQQNRDLEGTK